MKILYAVILCLVLSGCAASGLSNVEHAPGYAVPKWRAIEPKLKANDLPIFSSIAEINSYVNQVPFKSDMANYGVTDYWATPEQFFNRGGDCEDYALAKYSLILKSGLARKEDMKLVFVRDNDYRQDHAILVVGDLVLDNQDNKVRRTNMVQKSYRVIAIANQERGV